MVHSETANTKVNELRALLERLWAMGHPYACSMKEAGVTPADIRTPENVALLPLTTKTDLQEHYPLGWLACDKNDLVRFHATSGTTGNPTVVAYTANDVAWWKVGLQSAMKRAGVGKGDVIQVSYGYGLFTGSQGFHDAAEAMGVAVVPASGGFTERQFKLMRDLGTTVLTCTPSYAVKLCEVWDGFSRAQKGEYRLRLGIFGAEAWSQALREKLESAFGVPALDSYGLSEAMGPGVGMECLAKDGIHLWDEGFIFEIIDPETLRPLGPGEEGELVITSLKKEAFPIIRYRTRDLTSIIPGRCRCGDCGTRIARLRGRSDDMIIFHGVNIFPEAIERSICRVPGIAPHYQIKVWEADGFQQMSVTAERVHDFPAGDTEALGEKAKRALHRTLGVNVPVSIASPGDLPRFEGKGKHVVRV